MACGTTATAVATEALKAQGITKATLTALEKKGLAAPQQRTIEPVPFTKIQPILKNSPLALNDNSSPLRPLLVMNQPEGRYRTFLLDGVTGSGKTRLYLQAIEAAIHAGEANVVLVPGNRTNTSNSTPFRGSFHRTSCLLTFGFK